MDIQWFIEVISSEFIAQTLVGYTITEILDRVKNRLFNRKMTDGICQFYCCVADALKDTCEQLGWEFDITTIAETVVQPLTKQNVDFNQEYLGNLFSKYIGHEVTEKDLKQWVNCFLFRLSSDEYTQLREYLKLRRMLSSDNKPQLIEEIKDDYDEYIHNYQRKLFWSNNDNIALKNLYVWNSYYIGESKSKFDDLDILLEAFLDDNIENFLREKNIYQFYSTYSLFFQGYPGCGKTSLITKLASLYAQKYSCKYRFYFINMVKFAYSQVSLDNIVDKLNIKKEKLKNAILILDSLDEYMKSVKGAQNVLADLLDDLYDLDCKTIITCRNNFIDANVLRHCLNISLSEFNSKKARKWLENYHAVNPNFDLLEWEKRIEIIDKNISKIIFIPLILYICVVREINISKIKNIGELYDILFDEYHGEIATTSYRRRTSHKSQEWKEIRKLAVKISILMYQKGNATTEEIQKINNEAEQLEKYFGLDFYIEQSTLEIHFAHSSIWQYFVAEYIYMSFRAYESSKNEDEIVDCLSELLIPNQCLDDMILVFFNYFMERDNWHVKNSDRYIELLMNISNYSYTREGSKFDWIAALFREIFRIITLIFKKTFPHLLYKFFITTLSEDYKKNLIRYTNLIDVSPIISLKNYRLVGCKLDGINLSYSDVTGCVLRNSSFRNSCFDSARLKGAYANNCDFLGTSFQYADLKNIDLSHSNLCGCDFKNARLNGANFENSILDYVDFRGAKIQKMILKNAVFNNCIIDISQLRDLGLKETRGIGIQEILDYHIQVYDGKRFLSIHEIEEKYREINPVSYALWKKDILWVEDIEI